MLYAGYCLLAEAGLQILPVQAGNVVDGDVLGALHLAGAGVGAVAKAQFVHLGHHGAGTAGGFRTALRQQGQGAYTGSHKQHGGTVLTGGNTGAATYAGRCVHGQFSVIVRDKDVVAILCAAGTYGDETAGLHDLVEGGAVHHQVLDYRESAAAPGLHGNGGAGFKMTHEQLAGGYLVVRTVGTAIHIQGTGTADALTAVVIKSNGFNSFADELVIENIKHFEE